MAMFRQHWTGRKVLDDLLTRWKVVPVNPNEGWKTSHLGTGGANQYTVYCEGFTGIDPVSRGMLYAGMRGLNSGNMSHYNIDWDKRLELRFNVLRLGLEVGGTRGRIYLKCSSVWGDLTVLGIGLRISDYAVEGRAYGIAEGIVNLPNLVSDRLSRYRIIHIPESRVEFWVNEVKEGELTGDYVPRGNAGDGHFSLGISNTAGGVNCWLELSNIWIIQEW